MSDQDRYGHVLEGDRPGLRFVRRLRHRPERVWRALTESEHLRSWMPCDVVGERAAGARLQLPFWPEVAARYEIEGPVLEGEIRVWDPPRVFEWIWDADVLRFELEPDGDGTVLTLTTWIANPADPPMHLVAAGYHTCLDHLGRLLDTGSAPSVAEADPTPLEAAYAERMGTPVSGT